MNKHFSLTLLSILVFSSCKKNPIDRLVNPVPDGNVPQSSGVYVIYDDELKTGGGLAFIPRGENQSINLNDQNEPRLSGGHIQYTWTGEEVNGQHLFAGFNLLVSQDGSSLPTTPGKNLSAPGYTKLTLYLRGTLSDGNSVRIEGPDDGNGGVTVPLVEFDSSEINNNWKFVSLSVDATNYANVKIFLTVSIQYAQPPRTTAAGEGGTVYLDEIRYER